MFYKNMTKSGVGITMQIYPEENDCPGYFLLKKKRKWTYANHEKDSMPQSFQVQ
jgi:hypothetical protein